jgi:hypothetical protein
MLATLIRRVTVLVRARTKRDGSASQHGRAPLLAVLVVFAFAACATPALSATEGTTTAAEALEQHKVELAAAHAALIAQRRAEAQQRRAQLIAEREAHAVTRRQEKEALTGTRTTDYGFVEISCGFVTYHFENFSPGRHTVTEVVTVDGEHRPPVTFTFEIKSKGDTASNTIPISETPSAHRIDARAKWVLEGVRGGWDISSHRVCGTGGSGFSYTIEKRQHIEKGGEGLVTTPISGEVGQTIEYQITVTNTGSERILFTGFSDPVCDPNTIKGALEGPLAPGGFARYTCTHKITEADQHAGSVLNTAVVTGTPQNGGPPETKTTNTVETRIPSGSIELPGGSGGTGKEEEKKTETPTNTTTTTTPTGEVGVLGSKGSNPGSGTSAETASVPAISGRPRGCVRSNFTVSISSKGVRTVTFYVDSHRLRTLTHRNARHGKLAIHVKIATLAIGVHRIKARITMSPLTASAKAVIATRTLTFARCASATLSPRFTG